jgi:hypothetical protein
MQYTRPEFLDEETWIRLPLEAQRRLDATAQNQTNPPSINEGPAYAVFGEPTPLNVANQDSYDM